MYIYCSVCDFLIFIPKNDIRADFYRNNHLKSCINEDTILKEHIRKKEILQFEGRCIGIGWDDISQSGYANIMQSSD